MMQHNFGGGFRQVDDRLDPDLSDPSEFPVEDARDDCTLDLFADVDAPDTRGLHRRDDPETSVDAAALIVPKLTKVRLFVLELFSFSGAMTDAELEALPEVKGGEFEAGTARKRRSELSRAGLLEETGEKRFRPGRDKGAKQKEWRISEAGRSRLFAK